MVKIDMNYKRRLQLSLCHKMILTDKIKHIMKEKCRWDPIHQKGMIFRLYMKKKYTWGQIGPINQWKNTGRSCNIFAELNKIWPNSLKRLNIKNQYDFNRFCADPLLDPIPNKRPVALKKSPAPPALPDDGGRLPLFGKRPSLDSGSNSKKEKEKKKEKKKEKEKEKKKKKGGEGGDSDSSKPPAPKPKPPAPPVVECGPNQICAKTNSNGECIKCENENDDCDWETTPTPWCPKPPSGKKTPLPPYMDDPDGATREEKEAYFNYYFWREQDMGKRKWESSILPPLSTLTPDDILGLTLGPLIQPTNPQIEETSPSDDGTDYRKFFAPRPFDPIYPDVDNQLSPTTTSPPVTSTDPGTVGTTSHHDLAPVSSLRQMEDEWK